MTAATDEAEGKGGAENGFLLLDRVDSTNTFAKTHFADYPDGFLIFAREQSAGRGRLGRRWIVPPGMALTGSAIFKTVSAPFHAGALIALAALDAVREAAPGLPVFFKWPNDLYVREKKLAGVLSEGFPEAGRIAGVVSGIGINVNQSAADLAALDRPATSLAAAAGGMDFSLPQLYRALARTLRRRLALYRNDPEAVLAEWRKENRLLGENFEVVCTDGQRRFGKFLAIASDGAMIMETDAGRMRFDCGDVRIDTGSIDFDRVERAIRAGR